MARIEHDGKRVDPDRDRMYRRPAAWRNLKATADGAGHRLAEALAKLEDVEGWCPRLLLAVAAHFMATTNGETRAAAWCEYLAWVGTVDLAADFEEAVRKIMSEPDTAEGGAA